MDMVERVARGMAHAANDYEDGVLQWQCWELDAKAAIRALLEGLEPVAWRYFIKPQEAGMGKTLLRTSRDPHLVDDGWTETPLYDLSALKEVV